MAGAPSDGFDHYMLGAGSSTSTPGIAPVVGVGPGGVAGSGEAGSYQHLGQPGAGPSPPGSSMLLWTFPS